MTCTAQPDYFSLAMIRDHMDEIPIYACPAGYTIRTFQRGDERHWARIEALAGEFADQAEALRDFQEEFGHQLDALEDRCFLLQDTHGEPIGTATAWVGDLDGELRGRVHWVGIVPAYQGRKLAKPLLSAVMERLARGHPKAYLTTQTTSYRAVGLYLNFGFVPFLSDESGREGWRVVEQVLGRSIL